MRDDPNKFVHAYCAYFVCGYCVEGDVVVFNDPKIYNEYKCLSCEFCKRKGGCIQCTYKSCANAFHISCGRQKGCVITADEDSEPAVFYIYILIFNCIFKIAKEILLS